MVNRFHLYWHPFCSMFTRRLNPHPPFIVHPCLELGEAGGETQITVLIPCERIDVRKNGWEDRRRSGLMDCRETIVNFGSNRLISELPSSFHRPVRFGVLHAYRDLAVSLSFSLLTYFIIHERIYAVSLKLLTHGFSLFPIVKESRNLHYLISS